MNWCIIIGEFSLKDQVATVIYWPVAKWETMKRCPWIWELGEPCLQRYCMPRMPKIPLKNNGTVSSRSPSVIQTYLKLSETAIPWCPMCENFGKYPSKLDDISRLLSTVCPFALEGHATEGWSKQIIQLVCCPWFRKPSWWGSRR